MRVVDVRVGQKVFFIKELCIYEGYIVSFLNKKEVIVSKSAYSSKEKRTYGVDFFFTLSKAKKVLREIIEESNNGKSEIFNCEMRFNGGSVFIYSRFEESLKIYQFLNLENEDYSIKMNKFREILYILDKKEHIYYYPNEIHRVRILNEHPPFKIQYIHFNCVVYQFSHDNSVGINYIASRNPDYLFFDDLENFDLKYFDNNDLLKLISKTTNSIYYLYPYEHSKVEYYNSILTSIEKEKAKKHESIVVEKVLDFVKDKICVLINNDFPYVDVENLKDYLYQSLQEFYSNQSMNKFKHEVLLERNYEIMCSAIDEMQDLQEKSDIEDNINVIVNLFSSDNNFDMDTENY